MSDFSTPLDALDATEAIYKALSDHELSKLLSSMRLRAPTDRRSMVNALVQHNRLHTQLEGQLRAAARKDATRKVEIPVDPTNPELHTLESCIAHTSQPATFVDGALIANSSMTPVIPPPAFTLYNSNHAGISQVNSST